MTDFRGGAEKRRNSREAQRSTFARVLGSFDFDFRNTISSEADKFLPRLPAPPPEFRPVPGTAPQAISGAYRGYPAFYPPNALDECIRQASEGLNTQAIVSMIVATAVRALGTASSNSQSDNAPSLRPFVSKVLSMPASASVGLSSTRAPLILLPRVRFAGPTLALSPDSWRYVIRHRCCPAYEQCSATRLLRRDRIELRIGAGRKASPLRRWEAG